MATTTEEETLTDTEVQDPVDCGVCLATTTDCRVLPCQHVFCQTCLQKLLLAQDNGSYVLGCPTCHFPVELDSNGTAGLPTIGNKPIKAGVPGREKEESSKAPVCPKHSRPSQVYCETCQEVVCNLCAIESHKEHQYGLISRNIERYRKEISTALGRVKASGKGVDDSLGQIFTRKKEIENQSDEIKEEIHSLAERLVDLIRSSETKLLADLEKIAQSKLRTLSQQKNNGTTAAEAINSFTRKVTEDMSNLTSHELLSKKKEILETAESLIGTPHHPPIEKADLKLIGNGSLLVLNKDLGRIQHSFIYQYCKPVKSKETVLRAGTNGSLEFSVLGTDDSPLSLPLSLFKCQLTNSDNQTIDCTVEEKQPGVYSFGFTPIINGVHKLSVFIDGQPIPNSPFGIAVSPSLEIGGRELRAILDLRQPWGVAVGWEAKEGAVAVAESGSHCVVVIRGSDGKRIRVIGEKGKVDGKFTEPRGVAITSNGHLLVTDYNRIQKLTMGGQCLRSVCGKGSGPLQFNDPKGIAVHPQTGKIFIADTSNHRVQVLNSDFTFSHSFKGGAEFRFPWDVALDNSGHAYVVDNASHAVYKFTVEGEFVAKFGGKGFDPGRLNWPSGITYGSNGHLYVTDDNNCVSVFDTSGAFIRRIGLEDGDGADRATFKHPLGIASDNTGKLYISDCWNSRLIIL